MSDPYDLLLVGGILVNPATGIHQPMDVGVTGGRIAQMAPKSRSERKESCGCAWWLRDSGFDRLPCPQLLGVNPYGFNADSICLASGVTTAVDAGSSGAVNFLGFKKLVHEQSRARMLAFVALAQHGVLNDPGELENLKFADPYGAAQRVGDARNIGVGIKVRLHKKAVGDNGGEALRMAVRA